MRIACLSLLIIVSAACGPTIRIERDASTVEGEEGMLIVDAIERSRGVVA